MRPSSAQTADRLVWLSARLWTETRFPDDRTQQALASAQRCSLSSEATCFHMARELRMVFAFLNG